MSLHGIITQHNIVISSSSSFRCILLSLSLSLSLTERRGLVANTPDPFSRGPEFKSRPGDRLS
jgi:hypothetical protein